MLGNIPPVVCYAKQCLNFSKNTVAAVNSSVLHLRYASSSLQNFPHQFAGHYIAENNIITKVLLLFTKKIEINKVDKDK